MASASPGSRRARPPILVLQSWRALGYLRSLLPLVLANAAGTVLGALLLAGLDQKTFAILITAMVVLFLARGERLVGEPGARRAKLLTPVVGFAGGQVIVVLLVASVANLLWRTFVV